VSKFSKGLRTILGHLIINEDFFEIWERGNQHTEGFFGTSFSYSDITDLFEIFDHILNFFLMDFVEVDKVQDEVLELFHVSYNFPVCFTPIHDMGGREIESLHMRKTFHNQSEFFCIQFSERTPINI